MRAATQAAKLYELQRKSYFNPRSPRGLRHEPVLDEVTGITISIHAARVENDLRDLQ